MDVPENDIEAIKDWASSMPIIKRVRIYGSRIKGTNRTKSDLDVLIEHDVLEYDNDAHCTWINEKDRWQEHLQRRVSLKVHLESYIPGVSRLFGKVISSGETVLIYQRTVE